MGTYFQGQPSEGIYKLTYRNISGKGRVAVLESEDVTFVGQIIDEPHGRLINADKYEYPGDLIYEPTVIEAETHSADNKSCDSCRFDNKYDKESICSTCSRRYSDCYVPKSQ